MLAALGQSLYIHNHLNKDLQAAAALRSTTTGVLAGVHGASHEERAALGIMLCERWGSVGALSPGEESFYHRLLQLLGPQMAWWCMYYGKIAGVVGEVYPAGVVREGHENVKFEAKWASDGKDDLAAGEVRLKTKDEKESSKVQNIKKLVGKEPAALRVTVDFGQDDDSVLLAEGLLKALKQLEKIGKKKNWPGGEGGYKIDLRIKSVAGISLAKEDAEAELA